MIRRLTLLIPLLLILIGLESYIYRALAPIFEGNLWVYIVYNAAQVGTYASILYSILPVAATRRAGITPQMLNIFRGSIVAFILPKLLASLLLLFEDIVRVIRYAWSSFGSAEAYFPDRSPLFVGIVFIAALLLVVLLLYGVVFGKYRYRLKDVVIESSDVPEAFDGYKMVHISDIHSGTFDSVTKVSKGVNLINAQDPDLVLFTGDMVNNTASEIEPFMSVFGSIQSKDGKFSVLGNHDYGDYVRWPSHADKVKNLQRLIQHQAEMGFRMLMNERVQIERKGASINILGVENWGKPPFQQYGDLKAAARGVRSDQFSILMSHDPSHWDYQVKKHKADINLTLSGHTHGMQLGIDWLGIKWSPVKYRYRKWAGLYSESGKHLYVNRGFGFLGWPGRLGIWPEVTVIMLRRIN